MGKYIDEDSTSRECIDVNERVECTWSLRTGVDVICIDMDPSAQGRPPEVFRKTLLLRREMYINNARYVETP